MIGFSHSTGLRSTFTLSSSRGNLRNSSIRIPDTARPDVLVSRKELPFGSADGVHGLVFNRQLSAASGHAGTRPVTKKEKVAGREASPGSDLSVRYIYLFIQADP